MTAVPQDIAPELPKVVWQRLRDPARRPFCLLLLPRSDKTNNVYRVCPYLHDSPHLKSTLESHDDKVVVGYYSPTDDLEVARQIQEDIEATRSVLNAVIANGGHQ